MWLVPRWYFTCIYAALFVVYVRHFQVVGLRRLQRLPGVGRVHGLVCKVQKQRLKTRFTNGCVKCEAVSDKLTKEQWFVYFFMALSYGVTSTLLYVCMAPFLSRGCQLFVQPVMWINELSTAHSNLLRHPCFVWDLSPTFSVKNKTICMCTSDSLRTHKEHHL